MDNFILTSDSDIDIKPMNINRRIIKDSKDENNSAINNKLTTRKKRRRIIEVGSSSDEDIVIENLDSAEPNKEKYLQQVNKIKRNSGQKYYTKRGKFIPAKQFESKNCNCSKKCIERINETQRIEIFNKFWNIDDFNKQNVFLYASVQRESVNRRRPRNNSGTKRAYAYKFYLVTSGGNILVCKKFFINTFQISTGRIDRILKSHENIPKDMRGKMVGSCRRTSELLTNTVIDHIKSFPAFESHYTRSQNPERMFLNPELNIRKMYDLYLEKCNENNLSSVVNEWTYRKIFKRDFKLHFHLPRKDTCAKCDFLNMKIKTTTDDEEKTILVERHDVHLQNAELARKALQEDKILASENPDTYFAFSFDLQKALPYPKLSVSIAYYKRNMYVLNEGFHNFHDNKINMYVWDETVASRGSQEVASCCLKHLENVSTQSHVIAYSDMCTGQNRNLQMALMWLKVTQSNENNIDIIDHKFLLSGHSYLPNDADFGIIEMVNWLQICWLRFLRSAPYTILYKTSMKDPEFKTINLLPTRPGRPLKFEKIALAPLYENARPITYEKYKDMKQLLPYIPPVHHAYFETLPHAEHK
ncbi:uncharacterized protein [Anoplolepis gracilipes]|uniref:uncharacterized protein n=1 Tax=Anoplolepis gracilipes TaxID=354296 RepID=UPI003BA1B28F